MKLSSGSKDGPEKKTSPSSPRSAPLHETLSSRAQAVDQILPESATSNKVPRPAPAEALQESKDSPEKKASVSDPQSTRRHEALGTSTVPAAEESLGENSPASKMPRSGLGEAQPEESKESQGKKASVSNPQSTSSHESFATAGLVRDPGTTAVVPASPSPSHALSSETREVPKTQQMLDSAPAAANTPPAARITTDAASGEMQMHVGIRTAAFGAVEIYTSVHQNQVGLTIHGEHGLAHWFSGEVQNIESGLKDHHLNLATVELDKGGTSLQTATSSDHHHSQRNFPVLRGWQNNVTRDGANETNLVESATAGLAARFGETRVSIRI
jgi:hypothetical protein